MATLFETAELLAKLRKDPLGVRDASCVQVRHKRSRCDFCIAACSHDAITIHENELSIDQNLCTGCGACATVCPTEAIYLKDALVENVLLKIDEMEEGSMLLIACFNAGNLASIPSEFKMPANGEESPVQPLFVPCLAALDESVIVHAVCKKIALHYVSGNCSSCPNSNQAIIETVAIQSSNLVRSVVSDATSDANLPLWHHVEKTRNEEAPDTSPEMTRRDMFSQLVTRTTDSVAEAAAETFYVTHADTDKSTTLSEKLKQNDGSMKGASVQRNAQVLDDLYAYRSHEPDTADPHIKTRLFGKISLNNSDCDLCGICAKFCPTHALNSDIEPRENPLTNAARPFNPFKHATLKEALFDKIGESSHAAGELTFRANDCVACGLCVDVCPKQAIALERGIRKNDLFALEPTCLIKRA